VNEVQNTVGKCQTTSFACLGMKIKLEKRYLEKSKSVQATYEECRQIGWTEGKILHIETDNGNM